MTAFTVLPAIDLMHGSVVRLAQGDPKHQTTYDRDAGQAASRWVAAGATWLHVVDLDAALGGSGSTNRKALAAILSAKVPVQFGGGLRTLSEIERLISLGGRARNPGHSSRGRSASAEKGDLTLRLATGRRWDRCAQWPGQSARLD